MCSRSFRSSATAAALLAAASPGSAQQRTDPMTVTGALAASDARDAANRRYDSHTVRLAAGQRYRISVRSDAFDPVLEVARPGAAEAFQQNDDADGLNPVVGFTAPVSGTYTLRVIGFAEDAAGPYTLRTEMLPPLPPPMRGVPTSTETVTARIYQGALGPQAPEVDGKPTADYLIRLQGGQEAMIGLVAADNGFDPVVQIFRPDAREGEPLASDDDGGEELNALLVFRPDVTGDYVVRVTSFQPGAAGPYRLRVLQ